MDAIALKTIYYRGGVVTFRIPARWQEEYEESGGGTFYKAGDDTGTLRLNVLTLEAPAGKPVVDATPAKVLAGDATKHAATVVALRDGLAMVTYDVSAEEHGQPLVIRYWQIAQSMPPRNIRMAIFSYTLLEDQFGDTRFAAELELIDREVRAAEFAPVLGETPPAKKPWWRPW